MSQGIIVTGVLVHHPYKELRKWARISAVLAFSFYSTMAIDSNVKYRHEYIASVLFFSVLPFVLVHFGVKHLNYRFLRLYGVVQMVSTGCSIIQLVVWLFSVSKWNGICNDCNFAPANNYSCMFDDAEEKEWLISEDDCTELYGLNIVYVILYSCMVCTNLKSVKLLQSTHPAVTLVHEVVVESVFVDPLTV